MMLNMNPLPKFVREFVRNHKRLINYYICVPLILIGLVFLCVFADESKENFGIVMSVIYAVCFFGVSFALGLLIIGAGKNSDTGTRLPRP